MNDRAKKRHLTGDQEYEVGYGKPPAEHRFKKGQSGNPRGRPKGAKNKVPKPSDFEFGEQPANQMLLEEAYRTVTVREGDQLIELPAIKAVFRAMGVSAMKGNRLAQVAMAELVREIEEDHRRLKMDLFEAAVEFKIDAEKALKSAHNAGTPEPEILPHPDDMIVDLEKGVVHIRGPQTKEEKKEWDRLISRRDEAQEEVRYFAKKYRQARSDHRKEFWLGEWHFEQKMFDVINDRLPERYQRKLEERSWKSGASKPGEFAFTEEGKHISIRTASGAA